jgi:hypothetical protein
VPAALDLVAELPSKADVPLGLVNIESSAPVSVDSSVETPVQTALADAVKPATLDPLRDAPIVQVPEVSFMRQAKRDAFWRQTWVRLILSFLALCLAAVLLGQIAVHERDRIAAMKPELRPLLEQLCEPLACQVHLLKEIQSVQIDSSALTDLKNGAYRFEVTLVNTAAYPVALPAVELGITDTNGLVVASKVILPNDWPESPVQLSPRTEQALQIHMTLDKPQEWPMSGYRALVFYP